MTTTLNEPTPELAARLQEEVGFEERIVGTKMAAMGGANPSPIYTFAAAASFLHLDQYDPSNIDPHATVGYIDPGALARWIRGVFGDEELAAAVEGVTAEHEFYGQQVLPIKELLETRLAQSRKVLGLDGEVEDAAEEPQKAAAGQVGGAE